MMTAGILRLLSAGLASSVLLVAAVGCDSPDDGEGVSEPEAVGTRECDTRRVLCEITPPRCAPGETPSVRGSCFGPCVPIAQCKPETFECNDGPALCEIVPPRCPAGQTLTTRNGCFGPCVPANVCRGATSPPENKADCDTSKVLCEVLPRECPPGETQTVAADGFCFGGCVPVAQCKPRSFACDRGPALCEIVPPRCHAGERLTTRNGCFGPCVPAEICK
jgi:hypothetical protein